MTKAPLILSLATAIACGGSAKNARTPAPVQGPVAEPARPALTVAPFVLTITGTRRDGTRTVRVYRGSGDGVITADHGGGPREIARVSADGTFTPLEQGDSGIARLDADGALTVGGKRLPGRVGDDGTVYRGAEPILEIKGGQVVFLLEDLETSKVVANGEVVSETTWEIKVEGGDEVRRLVGAILLLQLAGGTEVSEPVDATPAPAQPPTAP